MVATRFRGGVWTLSPAFLLIGCTFDATGIDGYGRSDGGFVAPGDASPLAPDAGIRAPGDAGDVTTPSGDAAPLPVGLVPTGAASAAGDLGGDGGDSFSADCPEGRVVTGFDAADNSFGLCRMRALCSSVTIEPDGSVTLTGEARTEAHGDEDSYFDIDPVRCPQGSVVVGFSGSYSFSDIVHHIRIRCAPLEWVGDTFALGASAEVEDNLGSPHFHGDGSGDCSGSQVAAGFQGRAGTLLDNFQLRCYDLAPVFSPGGGEDDDDDDG